MRAQSAEITPPADTREKILDAAELLFIERGFAATSLRAIASRAGVNLAATHYHFGSKEGLLRATVDRRMEPLNEERVRLLEEAEAALLLALDTEPENPDFLFALGDHYFRRGMPERALEMANRLLAAAPGHTQGQQLKAAIERALGG